MTSMTQSGLIRQKHGRIAWIVAMVMTGVAAAVLHGCNTIEGVGQDVASAGQSLSDAAHDTNPTNK